MCFNMEMGLQSPTVSREGHFGKSLTKPALTSVEIEPLAREVCTISK